MRSVLSKTAGLLAVAAVALAGGAASAHAAASIAVTAPAGATTTPGLSASVGHALELSADDFSRPGGTHPGIYSIFGKLNWFPSAGGSGAWAEYIPSLNSQLFVSWLGSGTAFAANGLFSTTPTVGDFVFNSLGNNSTPGIVNKRLNVAASFVSQTSATIDCTDDQVNDPCGIITIGAHGQANAALETFTPVYFNGTPGAPLDPSDPGTVSTPTLTAPGTVDNDAGTFTVSGDFDDYDANWGQGFYLSYGQLEADWRPSLGAPPASRDAIHTYWVHPGATPSSTEADLDVDGTFSVSFPISSALAPGAEWDGVDPGYAVWAVPAHGTFPGLGAWEKAVGIEIVD